MSKLVKINDKNLDVIFDIRYATTKNVCKQILYHETYNELHQEAYIKFEKAVNYAKNLGYKFKIFDDIVLFKTRNQIVQDFNAFYLIACLNSGFTNQIHAYYDQNIYDNDCAGLNYKKIPEKYCDKFGRWHEINRCGSW